MLTKFETKSSRVKGLSFHASRPWILVSLHNGIVQLWDYRMGTLLDRFYEHDGPVRGIHFHPTQPLFVSGGDDYKIKVWNYKERRCLFTLLGHLDYVRTTFFHHDLPWILSASDDQTVRIWNWQSRQSVAVLTGHNHYVMCAQFHPTKDLIASASLDQTVRVWDFKALRKKHTRPTPTPASSAVGPPGLGPARQQVQTDLFGPTEVVVKHLLDGHDRGVNWVSFHPTLPFVVTGSDDRSVRLWRMSETSAWEVAVMRSHYNNVSCVLFHARNDMIVSDSEDKSIRVWDQNKRNCLQTFRRERDRFWFITEHPKQNLFAAGHDGGMIIFKLERERPAHTVHGDLIFYMRGKNLHCCDYRAKTDVTLFSVSPPPSSSSVRGKAIALTLSYDPSCNAVVAQYDSNGGTFEIYEIPKDRMPGVPSAIAGSKSDSKSSIPSARSLIKNGGGKCAVFVAHNRVAYLTKENKIVVLNVQTQKETKNFTPPIVGVDRIFYGGPGMILLRTDEKIAMLDIQQQRVVGEIALAGVKYVKWSDDMKYCALMAKHIVAIGDRKLLQLASQHEMIRVKSGAWDNNANVFIYSTLNHIKYLIPGVAEGGTLRTISHPLYITHVADAKIFTIDRQCKITSNVVDTSEYSFKLALDKKQYREVLRLMKHSRITGQSIIAYLQRKGYPEVALHFVKDDRSRFNLAVECGNLEVALEAAKNVDDKEFWDILAVEALRQGNHQIVEMAYQRTKNFDRLSFLYLLTGNDDKLRKMLKIAEMRDDVMGRFHNALYLGDVRERVKILQHAGAGSLPLAYALAKTHGLEQESSEIADKLKQAGVDLDSTQTGLEERIASGKASLMLPPTPILKSANWPLLSVAKGFFEGMLDEPIDDVVEEEHEVEGDWDGAELDIDGDLGLGSDAGDVEVDEEGDLDDDLDLGDGEGEGEGWEDDLDLGEMGLDVQAADDTFVAPLPGNPVEARWSSKSSLAADHAAAGDLIDFVKLLKSQIGIVNFKPLTPHILNARSGSHAVLGSLPCVPPLGIPLERSGGLPAQSLTLRTVDTKILAGRSATTAGKIDDAITHFKAAIYALPMLVVSRQQVDEVRERLAVCREYISGLRIEAARRLLAKPESKDQNKQRICELSAYFADRQLKDAKHRMIALRVGMTNNYQARNFGYAAAFAQRLINLGPDEKLRKTAVAVTNKANENNQQNAFDIAWDAALPNIICCVSLERVEEEKSVIQCSYCEAPANANANGSVCPVCDMGELGGAASGLLSSEHQHQRRR